MVADRVNPANPKIQIQMGGGVHCQNQDSHDVRIFRIMNGDG